MRTRIVLICRQNIRKAQAAGVNIMINTDAHNKEMLEDMKIGVSSEKGLLKKYRIKYIRYE